LGRPLAVEKKETATYQRKRMKKVKKSARNPGRVKLNVSGKEPSNLEAGTFVHLPGVG